MAHQNFTVYANLDQLHLDVKGTDDKKNGAICEAAIKRLKGTDQKEKKSLKWATQSNDDGIRTCVGFTISDTLCTAYFVYPESGALKKDDDEGMVLLTCVAKENKCTHIIPHVSHQEQTKRWTDHGYHVTSNMQFTPKAILQGPDCL
jgi:hypothetical protein